MNAEIDELRRLNRDLARNLVRILNVWDAWNDDAWDGEDRWQTFLAALDAAREWVGRETGATP